MKRPIIKVAAAALKIVRVEEKQRPIDKISEVRLTGSKNEYRKRKSFQGKRNGKFRRDRKNGHGFGKKDASHEEGMVRLSLARGREHGINPGEVVGTIASRADGRKRCATGRGCSNRRSRGPATLRG